MVRADRLFERLAVHLLSALKVHSELSCCRLRPIFECVDRDGNTSWTGVCSLVCLSYVSHMSLICPSYVSHMSLVCPTLTVHR